MLKTDTPSRADLDGAQAENLASMRAAVLRSTTCSAVRPYADALHADHLADAPLTTRSQLAEWGSRADAPHRITTGETRLVLRSSGSSGRVRTLLHDRVFTEQVEALGARGLCWEGLSANAYVLNALTPGDLFGGFGFADAALARRGAAVLPAGTSLPPQDLAELVADLGIEALVALPGYVQQLRAAVPDAVAALRTVFYLGDQMPASTVDALAADVTAVRSFAYSTTETGPIGHQCAHLTGSEHHVHEDLVVAEVVDPAGARLPYGQTGDLAVTVLTASGTALVRYLVGDKATLTPSACACGSAADVLRIGGRDGSSANIDGTVVTREMFDVALSPLGIPTEAIYQVVTAATGADFRLVLAGAALEGVDTDGALAALRGHQTLRKVVRSPRFRGLAVDTVSAPRTTFRGKHGFFIEEEDEHGR